MALIRAHDWGSEQFWQERILQYMLQQSHPREALHSRIIYVSVHHDQPVALVAGHLTRRFGCQGELQWISVKPEYRHRGIGDELLTRMAEWFVQHDALRICVDVEPTNTDAIRFYRKHGAEDFKASWMIWRDVRRILGR